MADETDFRNLDEDEKSLINDDICPVCGYKVHETVNLNETRQISPEESEYLHHTCIVGHLALITYQ